MTLKQTIILNLAAVLLFSAHASAENLSTVEPEKVDLKKLEDKYWAVKDSDLSVVQNRFYSKESRFFVSGAYGPLINDEWNIGRMTNLAGGYYFNERWGIELGQETGQLEKNEGIKQIEQFNGLRPNYNRFQSYQYVQALFVPFYAKMSFLDKKILYFDIQFALGIGQMTYQPQIDPTEAVSEDQKTIGVNFDFSQTLFFHQNWAVRVDVKNKWTTQDQVRYRLSGSGTQDRSLGKTNRQDSSFLIGIIYFH